MWSVIRKGFRRHALMVAFAGAALVAGLGVIAPESAQAATLYISEFASPVGQVGSVQANVYPQPAITDQTVAITGASVQSAAFNASTHAIQVECDSDCSVSIGTNPTATTTNYLMGDGIPYQFVVVPGQKIAVISNTSGGSGSDVNIVAVGGNAVGTSVPVNIVGSGASTFGAAFPTTGTAIGFTDGTNMQPAKVDSSGNQLVVGNVASGAADSGNPITIAGVANSTQPSFSNGQRGVLTLSTRGILVAGNLNNNNIAADAGTAYLSTAYNTATASPTAALMLFNGTTWDRARSVAGDAQAATGITAQTPMLWNGATYDRAGGTTAGQFAQGPVAGGVAKSGNPLPAGAEYNSTLPTYTDGQRTALQTGTRGSLNVTVSSINGTTQADVSNYNSDGAAAFSGMRTVSEPYLYNGSTIDRSRSGGVTGMAGVNPQATPSGGASFLNIAAGQATTTVKSGAGTLYAIILNSAATATNTTTVYDNTAASGTVIARPAATTATLPTTINYGPVGLAFATGLTIITATANGSDMTIVYK